MMLTHLPLNKFIPIITWVRSEKQQTKGEIFLLCSSEGSASKNKFIQNDSHIAHEIQLLDTLTAC